MTITVRKTKDGKVRYRAQLRKSIVGYPPYSVSKTFSSKAMAKEWLERKSLEIEKNPDIMLGKPSNAISLHDAITRFLEEFESRYGRSIPASLRAVQRMPIANVPIDKFSRTIIASHARDRHLGDVPNFPNKAAPPTVKAELSAIRSVLSAAMLSWGYQLSLAEFDLALQGLRQTRTIGSSGTREILPTAEELERLTLFFIDGWLSSRTCVPMHLIMWLAIYTTRREAEITRLEIKDFDRLNMTWLVRDVKDPSGAKGNHKIAVVPESALPLIDMLLSDAVRTRMLFNGGDPRFLVPLSPRTIGNKFTKAVKICGGDICFHSLRHEGITRLAEDGLTIPQMQKISLHCSWSALQRYASATPRGGERAEWGDYAMLL